MTLRIAWVGPWNERSAIAEFGSQIVRCLAALDHEVEVFRTEVDEWANLPPLPAPCVVHPSGAAIERLDTRFDAVLVNLGNYWPYHAAALDVLLRAPCISILHDVTLESLSHLWSDALATRGDPRGTRLAEAMRDAPFEAAAGLSVGAVVHSGHYYQRAEGSCPGPVATIPLAFEFPQLPPPREPSGRLTVATVGHVNPNKRAEEVIRAIGASPRLRVRANYVLIGEVSDARRAELLRLARRVGAPDPDIVGQVSENVLRTLVAGVDAFCCLRHPLTEGGSASLILALRSGRPTIVSDNGSYAEVPDGLVLKCPPGREAAHVLHYLEDLLDDPGAGLAMGRRARAHAEATYSPESYVAALLPHLERCGAGTQVVQARNRIRRTMEGIGSPTEPGDVAHAARGLDSLFGGRQNAP